MMLSYRRRIVSGSRCDIPARSFRWSLATTFVTSRMLTPNVVLFPYDRSQTHRPSKIRISGPSICGPSHTASQPNVFREDLR